MTTDKHPPADAGTWRRIDGGWELRFERWLRHSPEDVWAALTTPDGLRGWLAEAILDPVPGGRMDLHFRQPAHDCFPDTPAMRRQSNQVLVWDPPKRFDHTFGHAASIVSWRFEAERRGTRLTLIHRVPREWESDLSRTLAGWHHHLEALPSAVAHAPFPWSWNRWFSLRDQYAATMAPDPPSANPSDRSPDDDPHQTDEHPRR